MKLREPIYLLHLSVILTFLAVLQFLKITNAEAASLAEPDYSWETLLPARIRQVFLITKQLTSFHQYVQNDIFLNEDETMYMFTMELGSNKDKVQLQLDTGSGDLLVINQGAICSNDQKRNPTEDSCHSWGVFNLGSSKTVTNTNSKITASFFDGTLCTGDFIIDDIYFNSNIKVSQFQFATVTKTSTNNGILGIGRVAQELTPQKYDNLPVAMKNSGLINKIAYSLYLDNSTGGSIVFGGIDKAKYSGELVYLPFESQRIITVNLSSIEFENGKSLTIDDEVLIDSGTTYINVLPSVFDTIVDNFSSGGTRKGDLYIIDCEQPSDKFFTFKFKGVEIKVPYTDLVSEAIDQDTRQTVDNVCLLAVTANPTMTILGMNFMRHAYLVFDLEDNKLGIAPVKYTNQASINAF